MRTYVLKLKNIFKVQIIIRTLKRGFIILFASMLLVLSPITCYLDASRVQATAVAGASLLQILEGLLASFGITYLSSELFGDGTEGSSALDNLYDSWWESYTEERLKVINGGSGSEPDTEPDSGSGVKPVMIPTFEELIDSCKDGVIDISENTWNCLKTWAVEFAGKVSDYGGQITNLFMQSEYFPEDFLNPDLPNYAYFNYGGYFNIKSLPASGGIYTYNSSGDKSYVFHCFGSLGRDISWYGKILSHDYPFGSVGPYVVNIVKNLHTNMPIYSSREELEKNIGKENKKVMEPVWIYPGYNYQGGSQPELNPPKNPYSVPDMQTLQALQQGLKDNQNNIEQQNELLKGYFGNLGLDPNPDTDPETKPSEKPEESEKPTEKPEESEKPDVPEGAGGFTADLKKLFPFCIPFDLVRAFKVFNADPVAPKFEWTLKIKFIDFEYTFVLDLKEFDSAAVICRSLILILFILGLILVTRNLIRG